jgi:hypothetical protein
LSIKPKIEVCVFEVMDVDLKIMDNCVNDNKKCFL